MRELPQARSKKSGWATSLCELLQVMVCASKPCALAITAVPEGLQRGDTVVGNTRTLLMRHDVCIVVDTHKHSLARYGIQDIGIIKAWTVGCGCIADMVAWIYRQDGLLSMLQCDELVGMVLVYLPGQHPPAVERPMVGDHGVDDLFGDTSAPFTDPVGACRLSLTSTINANLGDTDPHWGGLSEHEGCVRELFDHEALKACAGYGATGLKERASELWHFLLSNRDRISYADLPQHLASWGARTTVVTADILSSCVYEHIGSITRLGGHCSRLPAMTFASFLLPNTFNTDDKGISFYPVINTMTVAEGGVRTSLHANFVRARLHNLSDVLQRKGLAARLPLQGYPLPKKRRRAVEVEAVNDHEEGSEGRSYPGISIEDK